MIDRSHTAHEPHPTAAMDRQYRERINEDEVVHIELVGKRKVYPEAAYNKLLAKHDRLREALEFAEKRSKQIGETSNDYYERLAAEFLTTHGHLPPGKDDPLRTVDRDILQQEWEEYLSEPANARRAALQEDRDDD